MKLEKVNDDVYDNEYYLVDDSGNTIATTDKVMLKECEDVKKLSKENCDEIFGVINVEKLAEENYPSGDDWTEEQSLIRKLAFKNGFSKAIELNKDKLFTIEDVEKAIAKAVFLTSEGDCGEHYDDLENIEKELEDIEKEFKREIDEFIQSLQQPTEVEVEIVMESTRPIHAMTDKGIKTFTQKERLDENSCLILTKTKI